MAHVSSHNDNFNSLWFKNKINVIKELFIFLCFYLKVKYNSQIILTDKNDK